MTNVDLLKYEQDAPKILINSKRTVVSPHSDRVSNFNVVDALAQCIKEAGFVISFATRRV
jgi:hypothetical protein